MPARFQSAGSMHLELPGIYARIHLSRIPDDVFTPRGFLWPPFRDWAAQATNMQELYIGIRVTNRSYADPRFYTGGKDIIQPVALFRKKVPCAIADARSILQRG
jgi:hypothetical protein